MFQVPALKESSKAFLLIMHLGFGTAKQVNLQKIQSSSHNTTIVTFIAAQR